MNLLEQTIAAIEPVRQEPAEEVSARLNSVMEGDADTLGLLRSLLLRYIAITGRRHPAPPENAPSSAAAITA